MKGFTAMMRILIALTSLTLTLMLVMSILPIATGQFAVEQDEPITADTDGVEITVKGSFKITSNLKEDVKDVNIYIYAESPKGVQLEIMNETQTIKAGQTISFPFEAKLSLTEAVMFMIVENNGKTDPGMTMPLNIGVKGVYFHDMLGFDFKMDYSLTISSTASVSVSEPTKNAAGEVTGVSATISGLDEADNVKAMVDQILPPGDELDIKFGTAGETDIGVKVKNGTDGKLTVELGTGSETAIKTAVDNILEKSQAGEEIVIDNGTETVVLTPEQVQSMYDMISAYADPALLEAIS